MASQDAILDHDASESAEPGRTSTTGESPTPGRPQRSLRQLALRGTLWTIVGHGAGQVLRLGGNLVLTRLLFPEAFGVMAIVNVYLMGLALFSDVGVGASIIQNRRGEEPRFYNTAWTVQVLRGFGLSLVAAALAWPVASGWYHKPEIAPLMIVAGLSPLIGGLNSAKIYMANRRLALGHLTVLELSTQILSLIAMVVLAWLTRSVWALVFGTLIGAAVKAVLSYLIMPGPASRPCWDREVLGELFRFGRWIFLATAVTFLAGQGDRVLLGRYLGESMLGVYSIAFMLGDAVTRVISSISSRVLFPVFSRVAHEGPERVAAAYDQVRRRLDLLSMPLMGFVIGVAPLIIEILYDDRYHAAGPLLQILGIRGAMGCILTMQSHLMNALGKPQYATLAVGLKAAVIFLGIPLGFTSGGVVGAAWVVGLCELPAGLALWWVMAHYRLLRLATESRAVGLCAIGLVIGFAIASIF